MEHIPEFEQKPQYVRVTSHGFHAFATLVRAPKQRRPRRSHAAARLSRDSASCTATGAAVRIM